MSAQGGLWLKITELSNNDLKTQQPNLAFHFVLLVSPPIELRGGAVTGTGEEGKDGFFCRTQREAQLEDQGAERERSGCRAGGGGVKGKAKRNTRVTRLPTPKTQEIVGSIE